MPLAPNVRSMELNIFFCGPGLDISKTSHGTSRKCLLFEKNDREAEPYIRE